MAQIQGETEDAEELRLGPVFDKETAQALSNSDALTLLKQIQLTRKADDPNYVPAPMVQQTQQYLERFSTVKSRVGAENMREVFLAANVKQFELCALMNLGPSTAEEAKALVPSLERIEDRFADDDTLQSVLDQAATFRDI